MKRFFAVTLFLLAIPAIAAENSVSGTWKIEGSVAGYEVHRVCIFKQEGKVLNGTCQEADQKPIPFTGNIKDQTVTWQYDVEFNGSALTATYTGDWDGDSAITGAIDVQPVNAAGTFTAKKDKRINRERAPGPGRLRLGPDWTCEFDPPDSPTCECRSKELALSCRSLRSS